VIKTAYVWFGLLSAALASAATPITPLGVDFSENLGTTALNNELSVQTAVGGDGSIYVLVNGSPNVLATGENSYLMKLTPAGDQTIYINNLGFHAGLLAADSSGSVYVASYTFVEKLAADGITPVYKTIIGQQLGIFGMAVDSSGRIYVTGYGTLAAIQATANAFQKAPAKTNNSHTFVVRLTASGVFDYATYLGGSTAEQTTGISVDSTGTAIVTGKTWSADFPVTKGAYSTTAGSSQATLGAAFVARLAADGGSLVYASYTGDPGDQSVALAADSAGNATVILNQGFIDGPSGALLQPGNILLKHFSPDGTSLTYSTILPRATLTGLVLDAAGDTYLTTYIQSAIYPVKSSLGQCMSTGSAALTVYDPSGNILQSTYLPGTAPVRGMIASLGLALGPNSTVYIAGFPDSTYTPTRQLTGSTNGPLFLTRLSPSAKNTPTQLACVGNSGSFDPGALAPGEIVSLFGENLGPATGTVPSIDVKVGFPTEVANVQVTFNGTPGPLLYVQAGQINAIAPWALEGRQSVDVCVVFNGTQSNCLNWPVAAAAPGVFTLDSFHAAALNQDQTINSPNNPAKIGTIVSIFATGLGPISPAQPDGSIVGSPLPVNQLTGQVITELKSLVTVDSPLKLYYNGQAPNLVAGANQINFQVADFTPQIKVLVPGHPDARSRIFTLYVTK
jgi:uncharacterized protein (TIGR03437 family)